MHIHSIPQLNISKNYIISQQTNNINPLDMLLQGIGISAYNKTTEQDLLKKQEYINLIKLQDYIDCTNKFNFIEKYLALPAFNELAQSKYFNEPQNFKKLTTAITNIEQQRQNALITVSSPYYQSTFLPDVLQIQAQTNISQCINNINKLYKSKFSDDLKEFIRDNTNIISDWKITAINLEYLNKENPQIEYLNSYMFGFM